MSVILHIAIEFQERDLLAGAAIAGTVAMAALFAGPVKGASMNPARSVAPAVLTGTWSDQWVYLTAAFLGAALARGVLRMIRPSVTASQARLLTARAQD